MVAHLISPLVAAAFAVVYWVIGMYNVMYPDTQWVKNWRGSNGVFLSIFNISVFHFFVIHFVSAVRVFELQSSICRDWRESRLSWFSWLHRTSVLRPSAWCEDTYTKTFFWGELIRNRNFSLQQLGNISKPRSLQNRNITLCTWCLPISSPAKIFTFIMCKRVEWKRSKL